VFCSGGSEVDAVLVVQTVQSVRSLLSAGGHGRGEHLLRGAVREDGRCDGQRRSDGERGKQLAN